MESKNGSEGTQGNLGKLPRGWAWTQLGDIVSFEYGKGLTKEKRDSRGNIPVYGSNGLVGYHSSALVDKPCLIVGRKGSAGEVHLSKVPCWAIDTTYFVIPPDGLEISFLFYLLSVLRLGALDKSTAIPGLNRNDAYALNIPFPPLPEQRRIVAKIEELFSELDAGVAALQKTKAQLRRYRQAVLKAAVEGRLTAEWRAANAGKVEPASAQLELIRSRKDAKAQSKKQLAPVDAAELGELPEGWCWASLECLAANEPHSITDGPFGSNLKTEHYTDSGPRVIRLQNIGDGVFYDAKAYISQNHFDKLRKHQIFAGDLVIAGLGENLPRSCLIPTFVGNAIVKADCIRFKPNSDVTSSSYLNIALNSEQLKKIASEIIHGVGRPRLNQQQIKSLSIPIAPLAEQQQIVAEVDRRLSVADEIEKTVNASLKQAERLRQSILKRAFAGKLVPQDPSDEPAEKLLERIRAERQSKDTIKPTKKPTVGKRKRKTKTNPRLFT